MDKEKKISKKFIKERIQEIEQNSDLVKAGKDDKGRFIKGNKCGTSVGISSLSVRRHRAAINDKAGELINILIDEAINKKNVQVAMWLVGKVVPDTKMATFANTKLISEMKTLTDLKEQAAETIKCSIEGDSSLEEASTLMGLYKDQKELIEASDIEPLVNDVRERLGRR